MANSRAIATARARASFALRLRDRSAEYNGRAWVLRVDFFFALFAAAASAGALVAQMTLAKASAPIQKPVRLVTIVGILADNSMSTRQY
jgi:hypothetical protein